MFIFKVWLIEGWSAQGQVRIHGKAVSKNQIRVSWGRINVLYTVSTPHPLHIGSLDSAIRTVSCYQCLSGTPLTWSTRE